MDINPLAFVLPGMKLAGNLSLDVASNAATGLFQKAKFGLAKTTKFQYTDSIERTHLRLLRFVEDPACDPKLSDLVLLGPRDARKLWVSGVNLGAISQLGDTWAAMSLEHQFQATMALLSGLPAVYAATSQPVVDVFWRTLCTDSDVAGRPAHDELRVYFRDWLAYHAFSALLQHLDVTKKAGAARKLEAYFRLHAAAETLAGADPAGGLVPSQAELRRQLAEIGHRAVGGDAQGSSKGAKEYVDKLRQAARRFEVFGLYYANYKRLFTTAGGLVGAGSQSLQAGQTVWILAGCPTPMILRPDPREAGCYRVIGEAYVHGIMFGEAVSQDTVWDTLCLV